MSRCFVDTNILVYAIDRDSQYHDWARRLLEGPQPNVTSSKNLSEYYAVVTKGDTPLLSPEDALADITAFRAMLEVYYPNEMSNQYLTELITTHRPKGLLIHDMEIAAIALANGVDTIATINTKDFAMIKELTCWHP